MMIAVVLSAFILFIVVRFIQADHGVRVLMVIVAVVVGIPSLMIDLLKKKRGSVDDVVPDLPLDP